MPAVVHVNRRLTDISQHFPTDFVSVGDRAFPVKSVDYLTDQFAAFNKANLLSIRDLTPIGDDELPPEIQIVLDPDTSYSCQVYGVSAPGKWITSKNSDPAIDWETERAIQLTLSLRLRLEYLKVKQTLRSTTLMSGFTATATSVSGSGRFDQAPTTTSVIDPLILKVTQIRNYNNGRGPNFISMASETLNAIAATTDFKGRVQYTLIPTGIADNSDARGTNGKAQLLEAMLGVAPGTIVLSDATYNSAAAGQTAVFKKFIGSDMIMAYVEPMGLRGYSFAQAFQWSAYPGAPTSIINVPQYNRGMVVQDELRAFTVVHPLIIKPELGYLVTACVDPAGAFMD